MDMKNLLEEINSLTAEVEKLSKSNMHKAAMPPKFDDTEEEAPEMEGKEESAPEMGANESAPEAEEAPEAFDIEGWQLNAKITSLMRQRFGINWSRHKAHHRLAERALADLKGAGDGKALRNLRNSSGNGSYTAALDAKFGPL